ncbi:hypothetical protein [Chlamydia crocodili]|uniref:hypothetical protein n=1 Tax=Chlamydia crocodili TaxID=2766982 RepID=UPI003D4A3C21
MITLDPQHGVIENSHKTKIFFDWLVKTSLISSKSTVYLASLVACVGIALAIAAAILFPTMPCFIIVGSTILALLSSIVLCGVLIYLWKTCPNPRHELNHLINEKMEIEHKHNLHAAEYASLNEKHKEFILAYRPAFFHFKEEIEEYRMLCQGGIISLIAHHKENLEQQREIIKPFLEKKGVQIKKYENS